jgi:hypothetical protein
MWAIMAKLRIWDKSVIIEKYHLFENAGINVSGFGAKRLAVHKDQKIDKRTSDYGTRYKKREAGKYQHVFNISLDNPEGGIFYVQV